MTAAARMPDLVSFSHELDDGRVLEVEAAVLMPRLGHSHPNDPDNDSSCEITAIRVAGAMVPFHDLARERVRVWATKTDVPLLEVLEQRAWEVADR